MSAQKLTPEQEKILATLVELVVIQLKAGMSKSEIVSTLVGGGMSYELADWFVSEVQRALLENAVSSLAFGKSGGGYSGGSYSSSTRRVLSTEEEKKNQMIGGATIAIIAIVIMAASDLSGAVNTICWGAIVLGAIAFLVGLVGWLNERS